MKVIWYNGNFGNQIFYCAYKDYLKEIYPNERIYAYIDSKCPPVSVEERTNLKMPDKSEIVNILSFFVFKILGAFFRRLPKKNVPKWYCCDGLLSDQSTFFDHSLQEKYYYAKKDSRWLSIKDSDNPLNDFIEWKKRITETPSVCVHLRRGDYVKQGSSYVDLSSTDYYKKAMEYANSILPNAVFYYFSDDLDYVKRMFKGENIYYVDCNMGDKSYLDMKLMSLAKVNIIANSTFSYWAAYINHENKTVIYPKKWFCDFTGRKAPDIMLEDWVGI